LGQDGLRSKNRRLEILEDSASVIRDPDEGFSSG
jgi:hypothetical protein